MAPHLRRPVVTIERAASMPPANLRELLEALDASTVRAVVLDVSGAPSPPTPGTEPFAWIERFPLPTVAALSGEVAGAATELAFACDIRVADPQTLLHVSAPGNRRHLLLFGVPGVVEMIERQGLVPATRALELGAVSELAAAGGSLAAAEAIARTIARRGPAATRLAKEAIWRGLELRLDQALRFETDLTLLLQTTKDRAEGVLAFLEKRDPSFTGS